MAVFSGRHRFKPPITSGMRRYVAENLLSGKENVPKTWH
jgi:hypothetical protein